MMQPDEIQQLCQKLEQEGEKVFAFFAALPPTAWERAVYTEGTTWTVRNVLAHLVTAERGLLRLYEQIRQGGPGAAEDFSIDRYNASQQEKTRHLTPEELLAEYRQARTASCAWVAQLTPTDLERRGRHPFLGETTLREMVKMLYLHNQLHLRDVRKALP